MQLKMRVEIVLSIKNFLNSKPIFYPTIDYLRFPRIWDKIKHFFNIPPVIHIVGTNGKGSTGRYLAMILHKSGKNVGHFTSPHIFDFNERFWLNGSLISDQNLQKAHESLLLYFEKSNLNPNEPSYFEWACLLAAELFSECDEIIIEAGVGGELDGTNVFTKKLSIFTPIDLDHKDLLGENLEQIATTKLNSMQNTALMSSKNKNILSLAKNIAKLKNCELILESDLDLANKYSQKHHLPLFLQDNFNLACNAAHVLNIANLGEIVENLEILDLRGRLEKINENLWIDVGHNAHAATMIANFFKGQKINLVYNAFADKDIEKILLILKPIIKILEIYKYESHNRALADELIFKIAKKLDISCSNFMSLKQNEKYLVFGSFVLVNNFIRNVIER